MKTYPLRILLVVTTLLLGCSRQGAEPTPNAPGSHIRSLGDEIAGLSLSDATALSNYLENRHGIAPAGQQRTGHGNETDESVPPHIKELGDKIAALSLEDASALSQYMENRHSLKPDSGTIRVKKLEPQGKPARIFTDVNDAVEAIENHEGPAESFLLPIADSMDDPTGANMAVITDSILARGWNPNGFEQCEGYRIYRYKED